MAHGLHLLEMEASDMLDVIHYFFEQDMDVASSEQAEAKSKTREHIYSTLYGTVYKYSYKSSSSSTPKNPEDYETEDAPVTADIKPFDPKREPTKAFIPASDFDPESTTPFGNGLDAPMR